MDDLVSHDVILTAGKDREDRHILVVNGCRFPDPKAFNYEDFLEYPYIYTLMVVLCLSAWTSLCRGSM
jgi:hypothetical protein